jgi:hypothetical protein
MWRENVRPRLRGREIPSSAGAFAHTVKDQLFVLDFSYVWFTSFSLSLLGRLGVGTGDAIDQNRIRTSMMIGLRICSDLAAVRTLVLCGADIQAKQIVRSVSENVDALALAQIKPEFCDEFVRDQDIDLNKGVWHRHISKGKARKAVRKHVDARPGGDHADEWEKYRNGEETVLAAAAHPSFITGWLTLFPHDGFHTSEDVVGISDHVSPHSVRTLEYCNFRTLGFLTYDLFFFNLCNGLGVKVRQDMAAGPLKSEIAMADGGRAVGVILMDYLLRFQNRYDDQAFPPGKDIGEDIQPKGAS